MSAPDLKQLISDIKAQPDWRSLAKRCADYYDHEQLTPKMKRRLERLGMPDITENLVHSPVNSVLGHEAQGRRSWMVQADDDDSQDVSEGLNQRLSEVMRMCEANQRCSDAYAGQIKVGIGWLHVRKAVYALRQPYEIETVHRDQIYYDMLDRSLGLDNAQWLARQRFMDVHEAKALIPKKFHSLIDGMATGWSEMHNWDFVEECGFTASQIENEWDSVTNNIEFLIDSARKRIAIYEVYYRVVEQTEIIEINGHEDAFDKNNPVHVEAVAFDGVPVEIKPVLRMRQAYFIGPHKISDRVSPYPHDYFPYVPFFGYREDQRNYPYGIIRGMIDSQDAYNNCNIRMHHILNQKRVILREGATDMTDSQIVDEVNRKDGVIRLKDGKSLNADILVEQDWQELYKLQEMKLAHEQKVRDIAGVYQAFSGKESGSQSGVAIASLAELGSVTLAEINDNYEYARKRLAELVLYYIVQGIGNKPQQIRIPESVTQAKKTILLNQPNEQGMNNLVLQARYQVVVAPVEYSPGYRKHMYMRLMEMYVASPDALKIQLLPMVIEMSDMPRRDEFLKKINESNGVIDDPEQKAAMEAQLQEQQQRELAMVQQEREADIALKQAEAKERATEADLNSARAANQLDEIEQRREERAQREQTVKDEQLQQARKTMAERELAVL